MQSQIKSLPKSEVEISVEAEPKDVQEAEQKALEKLSPRMKIPGFRPGKTPLAIVKTQLNPEALFRETLESLVSNVYQKAIQKHKLNPIAQPKVEIPNLKNVESLSATAGRVSQNPTIQFKVPILPKVKLGNYKKALSEIKTGKKVETAKTLHEAEQKAATEKKKLIERTKKVGKLTPLEQEQELEEKILNKLLEIAKFELPEILIQQESQQRLTSLREQVKKLGLSLEDYLKTRKKKIEDLKKDLQKETEKTIKLRFILLEIAQQEKISLEKGQDLRYIMKRLKKLTSSPHPSGVIPEGS